MHTYTTLEKHIISKKDLDKNGVYVIYHKSKPKVYYFGSTFKNESKTCKKGVYGRWIEHYSYLKRNKHHSIYLQNVVNKYGLEGLIFELVEICSTEEKARERESFYIDKYNTIKTGYNSMSDTFHPSMSEENRINSSDRMKDNNPMKNSESINKRLQTIGDSKKTKLLQYSIDGIFIKEHLSVQDAAKEINIDQSNITRHLTGEYKKSGGYLWFYKENFTLEILKEKLNNLKIRKPFSKESIEKRAEKQRRKILQYNISNNLIKEWNSIREAAKSLSIEESNISKCCSGTLYSYKGFIWKYKDASIINIIDDTEEMQPMRLLSLLKLKPMNNTIIFVKEGMMASHKDYLEFTKWIENTPLFKAIKQHAGTGLIIESLPYDFQLKLNGISKVERAEDLPIELIQNFYLNSPFYENNNSELKLINNEYTDKENLW